MTVARTGVRNGFDPETMTGDGGTVECKTCGGSGRLKHATTGKPSAVCPSCGGSGEVSDDGDGEDGQLGASARAPGTRLDGYFWARSWGSYLAAVSDPQDASGARSAIRKAMAETQLRNAAGSSERIPSGGGFLVPERLRSQVLAYMTSAIVRPRADVIPMDSLRVPVPVLDNPTQASSKQALGGMTFSMAAEGAAITPTVPNFGRIALEARKAAGYLQAVPNELVDDSAAFTDSFLPQIIARGYAWFEDDLFISQGLGVGEPQALINAPAAIVQARTTGSDVLLPDLINVLKKLHPASKSRATWIVADEVFGQLTDMYVNFGSATSGLTPPPNWLEFDPQSGCWRLLGLEICPHDHLPALGSTGDVILADLGLYLIGDRQEMTIERAQKGAGFVNGTSDFRIRSRIDARFWPQQPYTTAAGQTVSPLVILSA